MSKNKDRYYSEDTIFEDPAAFARYIAELRATGEIKDDGGSIPPIKPEPAERYQPSSIPGLGAIGNAVAQQLAAETYTKPKAHVVTESDTYASEVKVEPTQEKQSHSDDKIVIPYASLKLSAVDTSAGVMLRIENGEGERIHTRLCYGDANSVPNSYFDDHEDAAFDLVSDWYVALKLSMLPDFFAPFRKRYDYLKEVNATSYNVISVITAEVAHVICGYVIEDVSMEDFYIAFMDIARKYNANIFETINESVCKLLTGGCMQAVTNKDLYKESLDRYAEYRDSIHVPQGSPHYQFDDIESLVGDGSDPFELVDNQFTTVASVIERDTAKYYEIHEATEPMDEDEEEPEETLSLGEQIRSKIEAQSNSPASESEIPENSQVIGESAGASNDEKPFRDKADARGDSVGESVESVPENDEFESETVRSSSSGNAQTTEHQSQGCSTSIGDILKGMGYSSEGNSGDGNTGLSGDDASNDEGEGSEEKEEGPSVHPSGANADVIKINKKEEEKKDSMVINVTTLGK